MENDKKSLTKGGLYYLIYNVLNLAFPFINGIYVARILLPDSIGIVAAAQNFAQYFVIFAFLGIPTYGLREISKVRNNDDERNKVFSELFIINLISTVFFLSVYLVLIFSITAYREHISIYLVAGISIALNAFNISWLYEGLEEFKFISIRNLIFKALAFVLMLLLVRNQYDLIPYAFISVVGVAGNYLVNMAYAHRYARFTFKNLNFKRHMRSIFYLVAVNIAIELYSLVDITMMNFLCPKENIAFYKYGHQIEKLLAQVVNTFTIVLIPRISLYFKEKKYDEFNRLISKTLSIIFIVSIPMIVGIYFTSDYLMVKMYGDPYIASAKLLKLFSVLLVISPIGYLLGSRILLVTGNEKMMLVSVGIGAIVNVIGNAILIPKYMELGATIASIISEVVVMIVYVNMGRKHFKLQGVTPSIVRVLISSVTMGAYLYICRYLPFSPLLILLSQVVGAVLIYSAFLYITKEKIVYAYAQNLLKKIL